MAAPLLAAMQSTGQKVPLVVHGGAFLVLFVLIGFFYSFTDYSLLDGGARWWWCVGVVVVDQPRAGVVVTLGKERVLLLLL